MNPIRIEAVSDSASLIAGCVYANILYKVSRISEDRAKGLAEVHDNLTIGVPEGNAKAIVDVAKSVLNSTSGTIGEPLEDTEDGV